MKKVRRAVSFDLPRKSLGYNYNQSYGFTARRQSMGAEELRRWAATVRRALAKLREDRKRREAPPPTVGDSFPDAIDRFADDLEREES